MSLKDLYMVIVHKCLKTKCIIFIMTFVDIDMISMNIGIEFEYQIVIMHKIRLLLLQIK